MQKKRDVKKIIPIKKIIVLLILLITIVFVLFNKDCFLNETLDRININKGNPEGNVSTEMRIDKDMELVQPFVAKTAKIQKYRLYFSNPEKNKTKVKVDFFIQDKSGKTIGKPTTLSSKEISHKYGTEILVNGNESEANKNGIVNIKKASSSLDDVDIKEGETYYLHVKVSEISNDTKFGIFLVKPGKELKTMCVKADGKEVKGQKILSSTTYYAMSYKLIILFILMLLFAMILVLIPLERIQEWLKNKGKEIDLNKLLLRLMFIITPLFAYYTLSKIASYSTSEFLTQFFSIKGALNLMLVGFVWWLFYTFTNRVKLAIILTTAFSFIFGFANYLLILFRNSPLLATDLLSWKTGMAVAGTYTVSFDKDSLWLIVLSIIWICLAISLNGHKGLPLKARLVPLLIFFIWGGSVYYIIFNSNIFPKNGIKVNQFNPNWSYKKNGYALSFAASIRTAIVREPKGYDVSEVEKISKKYPSDKAIKAKEVSEQTPNIIVIMNESLSDLKYMGDFKTNEDYMPYMRSMKENTIKGTMHMSVIGSRTANSELEFLSGTTMQFFPEYTVPYVTMIKEKKPSLAWNMEKMGYEGNIAFHPGLVDSYNRNNVYPLLGFKKHLSIDDVKNPQLLRAYVSDACDYDVVIDQYNKHKKNKKPMFLFNVTIQNHGGYSVGSGVVDAGISITDPKLQGEIEAIQYLNLVKESDKAIEKLITYFENQDEPTVIALYGDHQPVLGSNFYKEMGRRTDPQKVSALERYDYRYRVPFFIWANFDIEEKENVDMSANYLQAYMLKQLNLPLTGYQKYLLDLQNDLKTISGISATDKDGNIFNPKVKNPLDKKINQYRKIQYNMFNDDKDRVEEFYNLK